MFIISVHWPTRRQVPPVLKSIFIFLTLTPILGMPNWAKIIIIILSMKLLNIFFLILAQHRALEARWHAKKIKLHQRLALRLFQEDVKQVLDWLQNHGEVFLRKNIGIGRNIAKARAYQKSHETFEGKNFLLVMLATVQQDLA